MREIELGKLLGEKPQPNIVKFIGCVTTQGKKCLQLFCLVNELGKLLHVWLSSVICMSERYFCI